MAARLDRVPLIVLLLAATAAAMLVPAIFALALREHAVARAFLYSGIVVGGLAGFVGLASTRPRPGSEPGGLLPMLAAVYVVVPAAMALPVAEALPAMRFQDAWFEMVSSFTTTGASLIETPRRVSEAIHLWRAMAGWAGGLFILVSALAFLAPLRLGGFELIDSGRVEAEGGAAAPRGSERSRLRAALALTLPWYAGLTLVLWLALAVGGMPGPAAAILAMSALSTSGILPRESLGAVGFGAEVLLLAAMALSLSRALTLPLPQDARLRGRGWRLRHDRELRLAGAAVLGVTLLVVARLWLGAYEAAESGDLPALGATAWGTLFTAVSFLTTTGFVGHDWIVSRAWSGLTPPGLVLMGLALMGGGVATTAGGVKLLRIAAMAHLGRAELNRLVHPSVVDGGSERIRFLATRGARDAWLFAMVFAIVAVALTGLLILTGETLESGLILAVAALTTTGPLIEVAGSQPHFWWQTSDAARVLLGLAMILGRLEILVILALALMQVSRN